jgi:hypothetical protein
MPFDGVARVMFVIDVELMSMLPWIWSNINLMMPFFPSDSVSILPGSWSMTFPGGKTLGLEAACGVSRNKSLIARAVQSLE